MDIDAVEGADPDRTGLQVPDVVDGLLQIVLPVGDLADQVEELPALAGQPHAPVFPVEEGQSKLLLHGVDDITDAGLGVAQDIGGPLEASRLDDLEEYRRVEFFHVFTSLSASI